MVLICSRKLDFKEENADYYEQIIYKRIETESWKERWAVNYTYRHVVSCRNQSINNEL